MKFLKKVIEVRNGRYRLTAVLSQDSGMFGYLIYGHTCSATLAIALNVACARVRCLASSVCRRLVYLESSYAEGQYGEVGMILLIFLLTIGSLRKWLRPKLVFPYLLVAPFFLGTGLPIVWGNATRFFTEDIIPAPIRNSEGIAVVAMVGRFALYQALPGIVKSLECTHSNHSISRVFGFNATNQPSLLKWLIKFSSWRCNSQWRYRWYF